jgi:hypothetical protein
MVDLFKRYKKILVTVVFSVYFSVDGIIPHGGSHTDLIPRSPSPPPRDSAPPLLEPLASHVTHFNNSTPPLSPAMGNHIEGEDQRLAVVLTEINSNHVDGGSQGNMTAASTIPTGNELSKSEIAEIRKHNLQVRTLVYKEVRRPGKSKYALYWLPLKTYNSS